jgi:hypothetical protein
LLAETKGKPRRWYNGLGPGTLRGAGTYGGASGDIDIGVGVRRERSGRSVALQSISVEGLVGLDVTVGVSALTLQWVP